MDIFDQLAAPPPQAAQPAGRDMFDDLIDAQTAEAAKPTITLKPTVYPTKTINGQTFIVPTQDFTQPPKLEQPLINVPKPAPSAQQRTLTSAAPEKLNAALQTPIWDYLPANMKSALSPSEFALEVAKKNPSDKFMGIVAGAESGLGKTAQAFTSPVALALLPSAGISPTAQKAMGIIFGSQMVAENPDIGKQLGEEMGKNPEDRDTAKIAALLTQGFANSSLAGLMFTHAASELLPKGSEKNAINIGETAGGNGNRRTPPGQVIQPQQGTPQNVPQPAPRVRVEGEAPPAPQRAPSPQPATPGENAGEVTFTPLTGEEAPDEIINRVSAMGGDEFAQLGQGGFNRINLPLGEKLRGNADGIASLEDALKKANDELAKAKSELGDNPTEQQIQNYVNLSAKPQFFNEALTIAKTEKPSAPPSEPPPVEASKPPLLPPEPKPAAPSAPVASNLKKPRVFKYQNGRVVVKVGEPYEVGGKQQQEFTVNGHGIVGWEAFKKEYPEAAQKIEDLESPQPVVEAPKRETKNVPVGNETPPAQSPPLESKIVDLINAPYTGAEKAAAMKKMAQERNITTKAMQEIVEAHVVRMANIIAHEPSLSPDQKFEKLKKLYDYQPRFTARTSTSVADQAYSTPVPLAYALNHAIGEGMDAYEPTAGNGALMIGDRLEASHANEKNQARSEELKKNGVGTVTQNDATAYTPPAKWFSRVKTNPPFGAIDNVNYGGFGIKRLEHLISLKALEAMKDDGSGYMILGAGLHSSETGKGAQRVFENYLYSHYNVVDNFEVSGDLYSHQGASFPVRVLVVHGRRSTPLPLGEYSPKQVDRLQAWDDVWNRTERIRNEIEQRRKGVGAAGPTAIPVAPKVEPKPAEVGGGAAPAPGEAVKPPRVGGKPRGGKRGKPPVGTQSPTGGTIEPPAGTAAKPEVSKPAAKPAGGAELQTGGVETGDETGGDTTSNGGDGSPVGSGGGKSGIVSRPDTLIDTELKNIDDIDSLLDEASAANKPTPPPKPPEEPPEEPPTAPAVKPKTPPPAPQPPSATAAIRDAAKHGVSGISESVQALNKLFGQGSGNLGTLGSFDEKTYAAAKPHFDKMWSEYQKAGQSLKEFAQAVFKNWGDVIKPYLKKFLEDKKSAPPEPPTPREPSKVKGTEFQVPYEPRSEAPAFGTLIPKSIAGGAHAYLDELKTRVGPLDDWLAKELDMPLDQLKRVLSAEQIDGASQAIDQMKNDGATIIGDQAGIGKGRQAAAVIRWALKNGTIPVFFTKDPKLFTDMYGDLSDIYGMDNPKQLATTIKPLIFGDVGKASIVDAEGNVIHRSPNKRQQDAAINDVLDRGLTEAGYNTIFATYSQVNTRNARQQFFERLAGDNPVVLVMDEAHEASGDGETSMQAAFFTGGTVKRGSGADQKKITVPGLLNASGTKTPRGGGVMYLSATYAKRPENTPVYFRTSLQKAADSFKDIVNAMERGGVALQQAVSEALAKAGQYLRREREFTGVSYDMVQVVPHDQNELVDHVDQVTDVLQQIVEFSAAVREATEGSTAMTGAQIDAADFASVVHNQIGQLLLAAKADAVVEKAIEAHKNGEKPVVALMNTMESFLDQYVEEKGIKAGDAMQLRWNELLKYALSRTIRRSEELPNGDTVVYPGNPEELSDNLKSLYYSIADTADGIESKFPVSPIDYIIQRLEKSGIKIAELTGRTSGLDYTDFENGHATYKHFQKANKNRVVNGFNNGTYDGMLLNASGSTGLSAHASEKFKDQKPRHMLIAQPAADINVFVQTLGRIFRTGLVMRGMSKPVIEAETGKVLEPAAPYGARYSHMVLPLQAELRPAAMAARKMKSLNANTTAEADNAIKIESEDFMNRYGDAIVADYLDQDPVLAQKLGLEIEHNQDGTPKVVKEIARTFTGRMMRMPDDWQKQAYQQIIPAYRELINNLKQTGEYDLEIVTHDDWDGVKTADEVLSPGKDENNIFTASVRLQNWQISDKRHVPSGAEMQAEIQKNFGTPEKGNADFDAFTEKTSQRLEAVNQNYIQQLSDPNISDVAAQKIDKAKKAHDEAISRWENNTVPTISSVLRTAGKVVQLVNHETGDSFEAMLVGMKYPKGNRIAPSAFQFKFMLDDPTGMVHITGSQIGSDKWTVDEIERDPANIKGGRRETRYDRYVITGNPIRAYKASNGKGKMVRFLSRDGDTVTGLLMPRKWSPKDLANDPRLDLMSGKAVAHFLKNNPGDYRNPTSIESGGLVTIQKNRSGSGSYTIRTGAAKRTGGDIYLDPKLRKITGDFTKKGSRMEASVDESDIEKAADAIRDITHSPFRPSGKPDELMPKVAESNNASKRGKMGPGLGAAIPEEFERQQQSPTATKNAQIELERAKRGLPPAIEPAKRAFGRVWDEAMAKFDQNPAIGDELVEELKNHPRAITDTENAILLRHQIDLQNDYGKLTQDLAEAHDDAKQFPNRLDDVAELKPRVASALDKLWDLYEVNKRVGTETARGLNSRKMLAYEDYTLAAMEIGKRAANGGRELTDAEHEEIRKLHDKIESLRKDYDEYVQQNDQKLSDLEAQKALDEIYRNQNPPIEPHIRTLADKIIASMESKAAAAAARMKARRGRTMALLDPTDLADAAIFGAFKLAKGVTEFGVWSAEMMKELGDFIKPHLKQIYDAAQKEFDRNISNQPEPVKRAVKKRSKAAPASQMDDIREKIRDRYESGKLDAITGYVQKLSRLYVEDGITDRDSLIDAVHSDLMDIDPTISRRDTMDAISGYGKFKQLTKDQVSVELRDLKGQMQQVAKLEDMQAGEPPKKTGLERRIPSKEESRLIKAVNEAKRKFQIPITDPNTQLKSALDTLKTRMQTRIDELNEKLANQDFSARPAREAIKLDAKGLDLHAKLERAKQAFQHALQLDRLKNRTNLEKAQDTLVKWRRGFLLSSPITLAKLTAAAVARMTITPVEEAAGSVIARAVPALAKRTQREGGLNGRAEAKALAGAFTKGMKDAWDVLRTGQSQLDVLYGQGREGYVGESFILPRSVIDFFGAIHGALKAPVKRAEFERSLEKRFASDIRDGADVTDPLVQTRLAVEAFKDANRSIFLQDNRIVSGYKALLRTWEAKSKQTGRVPVGGKLAATAARAVFPIVKVPVNIVAETMQYALGTVSGSARLGLAFRRGIETLKPDEADLIARELKKGTLGAAVLLTGFFLPQYFGGYYQQGEKRKPGEAKYGSIKIDGWNVPSFLLHNPLLEVAQLGATVRRVADSKLHKRDTGKQGITAGLVAGGLGLAEEVPFVNDTLELTKLMNPSQRAGYAGEMAKSYVVPQLVQFIANQTDKNAKGDTIARKPKTLLQHIETGIPGLRQTVPKKNPFEE